MSDCTYCGMPADTRDHVIPLAYSRGHRKGGEWRNQETVPCCRECNSLLGAKALFTVQARAAELSECLTTRYRKELKAPVWLEDELAELEPTLRQTIQAKQFLRDEVVERVRNCSAVGSGLLEAAQPLWSLPKCADTKLKAQGPS